MMDHFLSSRITEIQAGFDHFNETRGPHCSSEGKMGSDFGALYELQNGKNLNHESR